VQADTDEEGWLSADFPRELGVPCIIYGGALCVHFAFYTQRGEALEAVLDEIAGDP
jgi:hypothetical protein